MSRDPAARYANLRGKVDKAMDNINLMKSASRYEYGNATPLRQSRSPPRNKDLDEVNDSFAGARNRATAPMTEASRQHREQLCSVNGSGGWKTWSYERMTRLSVPMKQLCGASNQHCVAALFKVSAGYAVGTLRVSFNRFNNVKWSV